MTAIGWTEQAVADVEAIRDYVARDSSHYATLLVERLELLQPVERELGRTIHPTVVDPARWSIESQEADSFLGRVARGPILPVIGSIDVAAIAPTATG